jgi:hypothetical protein
VRRAVNPEEMVQGVDRSGKAAVQPAPSLGDELCNPLRDVCLAFGWFDVRKMPTAARFGHQLETQTDQASDLCQRHTTAHILSSARNMFFWKMLILPSFFSP